MLFEDFKEILRNIQKTSNKFNKKTNKALNNLLAWDGNTAPGSKQAAVWSKWCVYVCVCVLWKCVCVCVFDMYLALPSCSQCYYSF